MKNSKAVPVFLFLVVMLMPAHVALADTGPKPGMEFTFKQESGGDPLTVVSGILYECEQADCTDAAPLQELGPQGFWCDDLSCSAAAYGFSPYHQLEIEFSDGKTRQSNIFETAGFDSTYTVAVRPDDLLVESQLGSGSFFPRTAIIALVCGCLLASGALVAGAVVFLVLRRAKT
jgi:hypothetical protein